MPPAAPAKDEATAKAELDAIKELTAATDPDIRDADDGYEPELTEAEKEALKLDDTVDAEPFAVGKRYAAEAPAVEAAAAADTVTAGAGDDTALAASAGDETVEAAAAGANDDLVAPKVAPLSTPQLPADVQAAMAELDTKLAALDQKFEDGELDNKQYRAETRALDGERLGLTLKVQQAAIARDMLAAQAEQSWVSEYSGWFKSEEAADIKIKQPAVREAFNAIVTNIEKTPEGAKLDNKALLAKATEQFRADFEKPKPVKAKAADPTLPKRKELIDEKIPPTLGRVPAAQGNDPSGSGLDAVLDRIAETAPEQMEAAMAKLERENPDAYAKYLSI